MFKVVINFVSIASYVTLLGRTGLSENSVVMHFECVDNAF